MTLDKLLVDYLKPFYMRVAESESSGEFFEQDARWFAEHSDRTLLLRLAYSKEYSHDWYALRTGAFGDGSPGLSDDMLTLLAREPKRLVAVKQLSEHQHIKCVVWLGPVAWTVAREWHSTEAIACESDAKAQKLISEYERKGCGDESYCHRWLADLSAALNAEPVMQVRWAFQRIPQGAKAN